MDLRVSRGRKAILAKPVPSVRKAQRVPRATLALKVLREYPERD